MPSPPTTDTAWHPTSANPTPFEGLEPALVLDALADAGFAPDGRLQQLNSYENRVWQIGLEERAEAPDAPRFVIAKFYRPGRWSDAQIAEEHAFLAELASAELPVVAPLELAGAAPVPTLKTVSGDNAATALRLAASPRRVGRAPELEDPQVLQQLGRLIARLHTIGRQGRFVHRPALSAQSHGHAARAAVMQSPHFDPHRDAAWADASARALAAVDEAFERFARHGALATLRIHGDCHPGNVLWRSEASNEAAAGAHLVDFDDCTTGPAVQDLWMLLPGPLRDAQGQPRPDAQAALAHLLQGYEAFSDFDARELALIEPLRTLRMLHHSAWLATRWADPAFPAAFPWFGSANYWMEQAQSLREQVEGM